MVFLTYLLGIENASVDTLWIVNVLSISLLIQCLFFFIFIAGLIYTISKRINQLSTKNTEDLTPISFLFFIERWDNDETSHKLKNVAKRVVREGEIVVLITAEYLLEAKMVFNQLEKEYGNKFKVCQLHEKTRGLDIGKLALLSGVRMANHPYICFLTSSRKINHYSWEIVPKAYFISTHDKKKNLMVGYTRILGSNPLTNTIVRICSVHIQALSQAMLNLGINFLANPLNVAFEKEQYLKDPNVLKQSQDKNHLGSTFSHLNHTPFRAKVFWDNRLIVTDDYGINLAYLIQSGIRMVRLMESNFLSIVLLLLYSLSALVMWAGVVWSLLQYPTIQHVDLVIFLLSAVGFRCLAYWASFMYLAKRVSEKNVVVWLMPVFDVFFGIFAFPFGFIVWILKPFKKH